MALPHPSAMREQDTRRSLSRTGQQAGDLGARRPLDAETASHYRKLASTQLATRLKPLSTAYDRDL